jgi:uncharacterized protein YbjT (DUF2867 family)
MARFVIAGGHGQIALKLTRLLADRGDTVVGIVRNPDHQSDIADAGGEAAILDLEQAEEADVRLVLDGADVAVFAAGAGPGSGAARKDTVDRAAAALFAAAAERAGVRRHLQISAMGLERGERGGDDVFAVYLRAKKAAEDDLRERDLDWTILRPGRLTDDEPAGTVRLADSVPPGPISRADVAAVLAELAGAEQTAGRTLELVAGDTPVADAVRSL